jgi:hypothetical protein
MMENLSLVLIAMLPIIESLIRAYPTSKPVSLLIAGAAGLRKLVDLVKKIVGYVLMSLEIVAKILEFLDKTLPQNVKPSTEIK